MKGTGLWGCSVEGQPTVLWSAGPRAVGVAHGRVVGAARGPPHPRRHPREVLEHVYLYCTFLLEDIARPIDVVFEVVKEFLYAVFLGFTKPIKRPSEMNSL